VISLRFLSRPATSKQQGLPSREAIQAAHHRLAGRAHGKLLPRQAGPIAGFILGHPQATRFDLWQAEAFSLLQWRSTFGSAIVARPSGARFTRFTCFMKQSRYPPARETEVIAAR
jgi:hypothetical protein